MNKHSFAKTLFFTTLLLICATTILYGQTALYNQYKHRTDMRVACIMQYPITPDIKTDITMFVPKTKEDLWPMVQEFGLGLDKEEVYNCFEKEKKYTLYTYNVRKDDVKKCFGPITSDKDYKNMVVLAYSYNMGTIIIFHDIDTKERNKEIGIFLVNTLEQPDLLPKTSNRIDNDKLN